MPLSNFFVEPNPNAAQFLDDPLVSCYADKQRVLAYIQRAALEEFFRLSGDVRTGLPQWNRVIETNLDAFKHIIESKFDRDEWEVRDFCGQTCPELVVTLADMQRSVHEFRWPAVRAARAKPSPWARDPG